MNFFGRTLLARLRRPPNRKKPRSAWQNRAVLGVEQLDVRIVPAATVTAWNGGAMDGLWSSAGNWSAGVPDATHVAELTGSSTIKLDSATTNMTIAGLITHDPNELLSDFTGTLQLDKGATLTITSDVGDGGTGLKWTTNGTITNDQTGDSILLTGGGSNSNNFWNNGTIGTGNLATLYVAGGTGFQISGVTGPGGSSAVALGDKLVIGEDDLGDFTGGNSVTFHNQTNALTLSTGVVITVEGPVSGVHNSLIFDTDTTVAGMAGKAISTADTSVYIDNNDIVKRSGAGDLTIDPAIKNETGSELALTANLIVNNTISTGGGNTASIYQVGGKTDLSGGVLLTAMGGFRMTAGSLLTYGMTADTITLGGTTKLWMDGGSITLSADNSANYGQLNIGGAMAWTGGTYYFYCAPFSYVWRVPRRWEFSGRIYPMVDARSSVRRSTVLTSARIPANVVGRRSSTQAKITRSCGTVIHTVFF